MDAGCDLGGALVLILAASSAAAAAAEDFQLSLIQVLNLGNVRLAQVFVF